MRIAVQALAVGVASFFGSAQAMPIAQPPKGDPMITLAAGGCGPSWHRDVYGACVPNGPGWGGGVVVAPGIYGAPGYYHGGYYGGGYHGGYYHGGGHHYHGGAHYR